MTTSIFLFEAITNEPFLNVCEIWNGLDYKHLKTFCVNRINTEVTFLTVTCRVHLR